MTTNNKLIIGLTGQIACGKGTVASYFKEKYGATTYRFSTMLRDVLSRLYIDHSREHLQLISQILRENFGEDTLARVMAKDVEEEKHTLVVVDGIRRPDDVKYLKELPGFVLVAMDADMQVRFQRLTERSENTDDQTKTFEQFQKDHEGEAELKINEIAAQATERIDNNGSFDELYAQVEHILKTYGYKS